MSVTSDILRNWKTTAVGAIVIIGTLLHVMFPGKTQAVDTVEKGLTDILPIIIQLIGGFGLLFAKDGDKTGTTTTAKSNIENVKFPGMDSP